MKKVTDLEGSSVSPWLVAERIAFQSQSQQANRIRCPTTRDYILTGCRSLYGELATASRGRVD